MDTSVFDLSRNEILILFFLPSVINFAIYIYVCASFGSTPTNKYFSYFVLWLSIWEFAEGTVKISLPVETAIAWHKVSEMSFTLVVPFGLKFFIRLTEYKRSKSNNLLSLILFFPAILFIILIQTGFVRYEFVESNTWYWVANPVHNNATILFFVWSAIGGLAMTYILGHYYVKNKADSIIRKQALLLIIGTTLPVIVGLIAEVIFPLVLNLDDIPLTASFVTSLSIFSMIAIKKYRLFEYSPKYHWEEIIDQMSECILIVNTEGRIMYANNAFFILSGYVKDDLKFNRAEDFLYRAGEKELVDENADKMKSKVNGHRELNLKSASGEIITVLSSNSVYRNQKGKAIGSIYILTNINELKKAERNMAYNESRLRQAQEIAHVGSWEINLSSKKMVWSEEACRMYGIDPKERKNQSFDSWIKRIHPGDLGYVMSVIKKSQKNVSDFSFKHRILWENGMVKYIHSISKFEFDSSGFPTGLFGVCHDITENVESERTLRESEENMRTFINESLLSIYFVDPSTRRILYANPALTDLLGYSTDEFQNIPLYQFINHSAEDIEDRIQNVMQKKKINVGERQWKRKDGKIVHVLVSTFYHRRNGTEAIYVAAQDITERRLFEQQLRDTNEELKMFIYKASHDLRGPLASTLGLIYVSKNDVKDPVAANYLRMIETATQKLDYTLKELVKAMKIKEEAKFTDEIDFELLIDDILKKFVHFPKYDRLKIARNISYTGQYFSSKTIIETVIQNLIENSLKYQKSGNGDSTLNIEIKGSGERVILIIEDNGIGIDKAIQDRIFDMYFRGTTVASGSGLGLYLAKKGIEKLNGEIILESNIGEGTKFSILLPECSEAVTLPKTRTV